MEESGQSQISLTDAKLMKSKNGFIVAYNPQTAVDSNTHIVRDFQMTNQVTDHGLLKSTLEEIRMETKEIIERVADRGYRSEDDMVSCLEDGIIPHVILNCDKDVHEIEIEYKEAEQIDEKSEQPEEIKKHYMLGLYRKLMKIVNQDFLENLALPNVSAQKAQNTYLHPCASSKDAL